ncbi:MAG: aromatic ring-hydroxylating dioxygenase subunit alpha [Lacipirellulaceae bacterium]
MFVAQQALPHLLSPEAYWSEQQHQREQILFRSAWHLVATADELAQPGSYLTTELAGQPVQVRNCEGALIAFSNVCAHRHCLLTNETSGTSNAIQCQYHGWQYGADGYTRKIPEPKNFAPIDRESLRLPSYRVELCGQLVFVCLDDKAPSLEEFLGEFFPRLAERFGPQWRPFLRWNPEYPVNWKIPIENSLEAYHVPSIHPQTFKQDPGEARIEHTICDQRTSMSVPLPFDVHSRLDGWLQKRQSRFVAKLGYEPTGLYEQHHVFPNLLFSFTDAISLCHRVSPCGPTQSAGMVRQFGRIAEQPTWRRSAASAVWGRVTAGITKKIMQEDLALFPAIQAGMKASPHAGVLGRCEERLHAFQEYLQRTTTT